VPLPEWPESELLAAEKELLGFYVSGHPLTPFATLLQRYGLATTATLAQLPNRSMTRLGGLITAVQSGLSKKSGKPYAMVTLEDLAGTVQVLCMNDNYEKCRALLKPKTAVMVLGEVSLSEDKPKVFAQEILPLDDTPARFTEQVHLRLPAAKLEAEALLAVRDLATAHAGRCPLFLCLLQPGGESVFIEAHEQFRVTPSRALEAAVNERFGPGTYYAHVDTTPPAKPERRWPRRSHHGNGDE
jgi:DNA polymerase-3 subunit alpha